MSISIIENNNKFDQDFNIEFQTFKTYIDFFPYFVAKFYSKLSVDYDFNINFG